MSEKQFKLSSETVLQYQIMNNDTDLNESEVVDLLNKLYEENEKLRKDNQRQKTLRNKHWREIQARANGYNRIISSLENRIPHHIVEELRNAPLLDCDYEGVESNE